MDSNGDIVTNSVTINVDEALNKAPIVNAGEDRNVTLCKSIIISGSAIDNDGTIVSYEWKKGNTVLATTDSFVYKANAIGKDTLTLTATDDDGVSASDTVVITVCKCGCQK